MTLWETKEGDGACSNLLEQMHCAQARGNTSWREYGSIRFPTISDSQQCEQFIRICESLERVDVVPETVVLRDEGHSELLALFKILYEFGEKSTVLFENVSMSHAQWFVTHRSFNDKHSHMLSWFFPNSHITLSVTSGVVVHAICDGLWELIEQYVK